MSISPTRLHQYNLNAPHTPSSARSTESPKSTEEAPRLLSPQSTSSSEKTSKISREKLDEIKTKLRDQLNVKKGSPEARKDPMLETQRHPLDTRSLTLGKRYLSPDSK